MKNSDIKLFKRFDVAVFITVAVLAVCLFLSGLSFKSASTLVVTADGEQKIYSLSENKEINIESNGVSLTVTISEGAAYVSKTDCKNAVCSHSGRISRAGQIIVCAPAKVSVKIVGQGGDYDAITG